MPEIVTQCDVKDTTRIVGIQYRGLGDAGNIIEVRRSTYPVKDTKARVLTNPRARPLRPPGTSLTGINTDRVYVHTRRKGVGTSDWRYSRVKRRICENSNPKPTQVIEETTAQQVTEKKGLKRNMEQETNKNKKPRVTTVICRKRKPEDRETLRAINLNALRLVNILRITDEKRNKAHAGRETSPQTEATTRNQGTDRGAQPSSQLRICKEEVLPKGWNTVDMYWKMQFSGI